MTTEQIALQRLKEVCEKATPGPWKLDLRDYKIIGESERPVARLVWEWTIGNKDLKNACFIATSRTALPILIELCEAQDHLIAAKASAQLKDALGRACLDQRYLDAVADLNDATAAVEAARARLEEVCPKK